MRQQAKARQPQPSAAPQKTLPLAEPDYTLPKLPVKNQPLPPVQASIAEIVEEADQIIAEKESEDITPETESVSTDAAPLLSTENLKEAFEKFSKNFSASTAALIKMYTPQLSGNEVIVKMHKANINLLEPVKIEWQAFLKSYFDNNKIVLNIIEDDEIVKVAKAYTQREQLEEMAKENPLVKELVKKLNLKLK